MNVHLKASLIAHLIQDAQNDWRADSQQSTDWNNIITNYKMILQIKLGVASIYLFLDKKISVFDWSINEC